MFQHSLRYEFSELFNIAGLHKNFICLQKNSGHGFFHVRKTTKHQGQSIGLRVTHSGCDRKTIARTRHVEIGDENIEALRDNLIQSLGNVRYGDHFELVCFERLAHHEENCIIVVDQKNLRSCRTITSLLLASEEADTAA